MEAGRLEAEACGRYRMLPHLKEACACCKMCDLGLNKVRGEYDPHVFSSHGRRPTQFMIIGQNPGWNEVKDGVPFVGAPGRNFDKELSNYLWERNDFYITNAVKCFVNDSKAPTLKQVAQCEPFLRMEIAIVKPKLVVVFGAAAFSMVLPGSIEHRFSDRIGKITTSDKFDVKVFATYYPTHLSLLDKPKKKQFACDIKMLSQILGKYLSPF